MSQRIQNYIENINKRYKTGISREHAYRGDLQALLEDIARDVLVINDPSRIACGAPDYILTKRDIPVGYIEAKDVNADLESPAYEEQFERYLSSLDNIIFTDYLNFRLYVNGEFVTSVSLAETRNGSVVPISENFSQFENLIKDFTLYIGQTIKSPKKLAEMMAGKARMLSDVIERVLSSEEENQENSSLKDQMEAFQKVLINDIKPKEFADIYAQTIAYGMFAARLHDPSLDTFTRQEASEQIPKTNPFLRKLFGYIAGPEIDERIKWIVDSLADVFRATDVSALLKNFGRSTQAHDPVIHFYETFLSEYDPKLRKSRGVWYTPEPVVSFIVRAVDDILKSEFGLEQGLSDTSKIKIKVEGQGKKIQTEVHKVQILDPATGTGTFLAEVIKHIHKGFENQQGIWSSYVENHLIPRLNGFELLMASYAMAHLKLDMLLSETGYKPTKEQRFRIYLTNSLEEYHPYTGTLFTSWLSQEANEANHVKRDTPVMVVLGNPPYAVSSTNKSTWIQTLIEDYKRDLKEQNINSLSDDYIKFIRLGQWFVERNNEGILAFITNNSFVDGLVHRKMREVLLESFDTIYVLDLHGNSNRNKTAPDGGVDENVFDIRQGVSISFFVKKKKGKSAKCDLFHTELWGTRETKYEYLMSNRVSEIGWKKVRPTEPNFFFIPEKNNKDVSLYNSYISVTDIFNSYSSAIKFRKENLLVHFTKGAVKEMLHDAHTLSLESFSEKYNSKDTRSWKLSDVLPLLQYDNEGAIRAVSYRPFDTRYTYYPEFVISKIIDRGDSRIGMMKNFFTPNYGLIFTRQVAERDYSHIFVTNSLVDGRMTVSNRGMAYVAPLWITSDTNPLFAEEGDKTSNINIDVFNKFKAVDSNILELDIFDYIYAILHAPVYRLKFRKFLQIDFPRVPYPKNKESFKRLTELGSELRQTHLLESSTVSNYITSYPENGSNLVDKIVFDNNRVWINERQYFDNVPKLAWEFYIGGYQPAQKWLKDRKGRKLDFDDIQHYQKIIVALTKTDRLMQEIDAIVSKDYLK